MCNKSGLMGSKTRRPSSPRRRTIPIKARVAKMARVARVEKDKMDRRARARARAMRARDMAVVEASLLRGAIAWEGILCPQQGYHLNSL